jgi:acetyl-CoA carboxylase/biotin carboxylase 1
VTEFNDLFTQCQELIEKQQLPPNGMLKSSVDVQFVYEAVQYKLRVSESSESHYTIHLNNSFIQICARKMADGGLLISLQGKNQMTYWKKEAESTRLTINRLTCLISREIDPSILRSTSSGRLVRFLVTDGSIVSANDVIAEIEVMKMYIPITVPENGTINLMKQAGCNVEVGEIIGKLPFFSHFSNLKAGRTESC